MDQMSAAYGYNNGQNFSFDPGHSIHSMPASVGPYDCYGNAYGYNAQACYP